VDATRAAVTVVLAATENKEAPNALELLNHDDEELGVDEGTTAGFESGAFAAAVSVSLTSSPLSEDPSSTFGVPALAVAPLRNCFARPIIELIVSVVTSVT
jgi:hypothetical protein